MLLFLQDVTHNIKLERGDDSKSKLKEIFFRLIETNRSENDQMDQ